MSENVDGTSRNDPSPVAPTACGDAEAHVGNYTRMRTDLLPKNKETLFDALAAAGITVVVVTFDGGGDEGQIESIEARNGDDPVEFPDVKIVLQRAVLDVFRKADVVALTETLPEAVEALVYEFLSQVQEGWENGEGAYGDVTFDVQTRAVTLDFNERFIDSENSKYEF